MTRDHYSGVPKFRNVIVNPENKLDIEGIIRPPISPKQHISAIDEAFILEGQEGVTNTIYVRTTGNDTTGDGTLDKPYATIQKAFSVFPFTFKDATYTIDITDMGTISVTDTLTFPAVVCDTPRNIDLTLPVDVLLTYGVILRATPTTVLTLESSDITSFTGKSTTGLKVINLNSSILTPGAHVGQFIWGSGLRQFGIITDNTANTIETTQRFSFTAPLYIGTHSAEILLNDAGSLVPTFKLFNVRANMLIDGIKFSNLNKDIRIPSFDAEGCLNLTLQRVQTDGLVLTNVSEAETHALNCSSTETPHPTSPATNGATVTIERDSFVWFQESYFKNTQWRVRNSGFQLDESVCDTCTAVGAGNLSSDGNSFSSLKYVHVLDGLEDGVEFTGNFRGYMFDCVVEDCVRSGVRISGGLIDLDDVDGGGNGRYGLEVTDGAHVTTPRCSVSGTLGDMLAGSNSVRSWDDFRNNAPVKEEVDATTQFVRINE